VHRLASRLVTETRQQQVLSNKDLDLPTQQELLAQFRCDEIAQVVIETFLAESKATRRPVETGSIIQGLGALMSEWRSAALGALHSCVQVEADPYR
jgi:hypothetical protein